MLVCQCNVITDRDIREVVLSFLHQDPWGLIVPAKVYRELERRCRCSGCVPNVVDIITKVTEEYHLQLAEQSGVPVEAPPRLPVKRHSGGRKNERRSPSHRAA